jgi:hypothetical protein
MEMSPPFQRDTGEFQQGGLSFFVSLLALLIAAGALFRRYLRPEPSVHSEYDGWEDSLGV